MMKVQVAEEHRVRAKRIVAGQDDLELNGVVTLRCAGWPGVPTVYECEDNDDAMKLWLACG